MHGQFAVFGLPVHERAEIYYLFSQWQTVATVSASDGQGHDFFGHATDVFADWAIVGAPGHGHNGTSGSGGVYLYQNIGGIWDEITELSADALQDGASFGAAVAVNGRHAIVGAPGEDLLYCVDAECEIEEWLEDAGAAYVFERVDGVWQPDGRLVASDPRAGAQFGTSVAIHDAAALVGAPRHDELEQVVLADVYPAGAAYLFYPGAGGWEEEARLMASDAPATVHFGYDVALDADWALVGAPGWKDPTDGFERIWDAAYLYTGIVCLNDEQAPIGLSAFEELELVDGVERRRIVFTVADDGGIYAVDFSELENVDVEFVEVVRQIFIDEEGDGGTSYRLDDLPSEIALTIDDLGDYSFELTIHDACGRSLRVTPDLLESLIEAGGDG